MTGTQNHECLAGTLAAINYLADIGRAHLDQPKLPRRAALTAAFAAIGGYERSLCRRLLEGLQSLDSIRVWGITNPERLDERLPTVSITHEHLKPQAVAETLAERGLFAWHGNYYALQLSETLKREPEGMVRLGLVHYNTVEEVDRLLDALGELN
jgi:selenocysteine lyase/cysteine desulfurase